LCPRLKERPSKSTLKSNFHFYMRNFFSITTIKLSFFRPDLHSWRIHLRQRKMHSEKMALRQGQTLFNFIQVLLMLLFLLLLLLSLFFCRFCCWCLRCFVVLLLLLFCSSYCCFVVLLLLLLLLLLLWCFFCWYITLSSKFKYQLV